MVGCAGGDDAILVSPSFDILVAYEDAWSPPRQLCFPCVADWLPRQLCLPSVAKLLIWSEVIMLGARLASSVSLAVPPAQLSFPCVSVRHLR